MFRKFSDLPGFQRDALGFFLDNGANATGPLVRLNVGFDPVYLVADPTIAKAVLKADEADVDKGRLIWKLREVIGRSMLTISRARAPSAPRSCSLRVREGCRRALRPRHGRRHHRVDRGDGPGRRVRRA